MGKAVVEWHTKARGRSRPRSCWLRMQTFTCKKSAENHRTKQSKPLQQLRLHFNSNKLACKMGVCSSGEEDVLTPKQSKGDFSLIYFSLHEASFLIEALPVSMWLPWTYTSHQPVVEWHTQRQMGGQVSNLVDLGGKLSLVRTVHKTAETNENKTMRATFR